MNEQWLEYWANLFQRRNYQAIDVIRKKIWHNTNVAWWYAQNMLLYASSAYLENHRSLQEEFERTSASALSMIHPKLYSIHAKQLGLIPKPLRLLLTLIAENTLIRALIAQKIRSSKHAKQPKPLRLLLTLIAENTLIRALIAQKIHSSKFYIRKPSN